MLGYLFYPLFWAPFFNLLSKLHIQASNLSFSWAPDFCSSLYIFTCLSHLCLRLTIFLPNLPFSLFPCSVTRVRTIAYRVFQARKSSMCYNFYHLNISSLLLLPLSPTVIGLVHCSNFLLSSLATLQLTHPLYYKHMIFENQLWSCSFPI